jgi:hypothetical protein
VMSSIGSRRGSWRFRRVTRRMTVWRTSWVILDRERVR